MSSTQRAVSSNGTPPRNHHRPHPHQHVAEHKDDDDWSGDGDGDGDGEGEGDDEEDVVGGADEGSRKRKRPMSVSCELCKSRKV
jgi:hypothetical protein